MVSGSVDLQFEIRPDCGCNPVRSHPGRSFPATRGLLAAPGSGRLTPADRGLATRRGTSTDRGEGFPGPPLGAAEAPARSVRSTSITTSPPGPRRSRHPSHAPTQPSGLASTGRKLARSCAADSCVETGHEPGRRAAEARPSQAGRLRRVRPGRPGPPSPSGSAAAAPRRFRPTPIDPARSVRPQGDGRPKIAPDEIQGLGSR